MLVTTSPCKSPQYELQSLSDLENIPLTTTSAATTIVPGPFQSVGSSSVTAIGTGAAPSKAAGVQPIQILGNVATLIRGGEPATVSHYNIAPVLDIYGNVVNSDLRSVSDKISLIIEQHRKELPRGSQIVLRGQVQTMNSSFIGLTSGLAFSILLVYLLIVVNFPVVARSFYDHCCVACRVMRHRVDVVYYGNPHQRACSDGFHHDHGRGHGEFHPGDQFRPRTNGRKRRGRHAAALSAGYTRFRPVIMTALAMIIGMMPMALGLGEGGEQNAPRAGRSSVDCCSQPLATLFFVPTFFSVIHGWLGRRSEQTAAPPAGRIWTIRRL